MATQQPGVPIRLAVQSRRRLMCDALVAYFGSLADVVVVGHVAGSAGVSALCQLRRPDVLLIDAEVRPSEALRTLALLQRRYPQIRAVLVYDRLTTEQLTEARRAGASVLVPSRHGLAALAGQIRQQAPAVSSAARAGLTDRQLEIIMLLGAGHSVPEIAALLGIAGDTVENHKRRIFAKLQAHSAVHLVARAASLGVLTGGLTGQPTGMAALSGAERAAAGPVELTARESDILGSISLGHTVRQTAQSLGIAPKTVENTQARLFSKLGVRNRAGALAAAYARGLLEPPAPDDPLHTATG